MHPTDALKQLAQPEEEDPALHVVWNDHAGQIQMQLMGEVQLEVLQRLIADRFGMQVQFDAGQITYKETIAEPVEGVGHYEPLCHYAEVHLLLEPLPQGSGLQFGVNCREDDLERNWQRLVLTHLEEKTHLGVLTGSPITDMRITLCAGKAHVKHTEGGDFRQATYRAVRNGLRKAKSILLEPWYEFLLELPTENVGRAMTDLQQMGAEFQPPETEGDRSVLQGSAPVAKLRGYASEVTGYTTAWADWSVPPRAMLPVRIRKKSLPQWGMTATAIWKTLRIPFSVPTEPALPSSGTRWNSTCTCPAACTSWKNPTNRRHRCGCRGQPMGAVWQRTRNSWQSLNGLTEKSTAIPDRHSTPPKRRTPRQHITASRIRRMTGRSTCW
ncbi:MAG: hypothetical protein ACLR1R_10030 [Ruminococcus callidus]